MKQRKPALETVRSVDAVLGRPLALELAMPGGKGAIRADRGIVLR
jgi:hypothetical protein